jgi:penicillin G amidase
MGVARRRHFAHIAPIRAILAAVGLFIVFFVLALAWFVRAPLPKINGTFDAPGLSADVVIRRDASGIPHIAAASADDAFYGQGFACAQDRLWQMDLLRREAEGRLSEILGPVTVSVDEYFRTLGLGHVAARAVANARPDERSMLEAFAAGVNAAEQRQLPLEFRILGYAPEPWTPADSLAVGLLITRDQDDNWKDLVVRSDLASKVGTRAAIALTDNQIVPLEEYVPGYAPAAPQKPQRTAATGPRIAWSLAPGVDSPSASDHQGSNNWAVASSRTTTGKPVLSNDTHLDHTLPSTWWMSQVSGGGFDVEGFTLPGVPGVIIGHNRRIAWGVTSAAEDVEDLYVERFASSTSDMYRANGRWLRAVHRRERIVVKGHPDVNVDVLVTRHGPMIKRSGASGLALSWTVLRDGLNLRAVTDFDRAGNWREFRAALAEFVGPTLNFAYADVDGHIGYQDAGRVPSRASGDGSMPVEGEDDRFAWTGEVPFDKLPHALDPQRGFLASANNALVPPSFAPTLSRDFLSPYRIHEIVQRLSEPGRRSPQAIGAIEGDSYDYPRSRLAAVAAPILASSPSQADRDLAEVLRRWNGMASEDSEAPTFLAALDGALQDHLLRSKVGPSLATRYAKEHHFLTPVVRALDGDASLSSIGLTRSAVLRAILPAAREAELQLDYPARPLRRWGDVNAAVYEHPLGSVGWPLTLLNAPTLPQPGDVFTVFQSKPDFGPSMRFVADLSNWDQSSMLLTLGESGVWTDSHYNDMERDWVNVGWRATPFTDSAILKATTDALTLRPPRR